MEDETDLLICIVLLIVAGNLMRELNLRAASGAQLYYVMRSNLKKRKVRTSPRFYIRNRSTHFNMTVFTPMGNSDYRDLTRFGRPFFEEIVADPYSELKNSAPHCFYDIPNRHLEPRRIVAVALTKLSSGYGHLGMFHAVGLGVSMILESLEIRTFGKLGKPSVMVIH